MEQLGKYGFLRRDYLKNHKILCIRSCFCRTLLESIFWKWTRQPENGKK
nr:MULTISPECIES: TnpV protein [Blautia]